MSFFSRKKQPSNSTNPGAHPNIIVAQTPSQALAQTRESAARSAPAHQPSGSSSNIRAQSPSAQMLPSSITSRTINAPEPQSITQQMVPHQQHRQPNYPWSMRQLTMLPQSPLPRSPPQNPALSPNPFPRYGHSVPAVGNQTGDLFLFGGLVRDTVRNDLYCISSRDQSASLWQVQGDTPSPRVGHASALVSNVLIVWGGDTKSDGRVSTGEKLDDGLYLLNLVTREWTRIDPEGAKPLGRYGHAVAMIGTRFYVFGGQVDGEFLNDLWSFDLNSLVKSEPRWESVQSFNDPPNRRTGHACAAYGEMLYVFGGTDGQYHYNDTWCFDPRSQRWSELQCIGFIPAPREGHSVAIVDDVIYIFGGRGVDGKDLGDLTGFKISNKRWYMFQNMGPAPSGRSGHSMAGVGSRIYVLGGESYTSARPDDPNTFHLLDTKHIKYPDASSSSRSVQNRKPSVGSSQAPQSQTASIGNRATSPSNPEGEPLKRAVSPSRSAVITLTNGHTNGPVAVLNSRNESLNEETEPEINPGRSTPSEKQERFKIPDYSSRARSPTPAAALQPHAEAPQDPSDVVVSHNRIAQGMTSPSETLQNAKAQGSITSGHGYSASAGNIQQEAFRVLKQEVNTLRKRENWIKAVLVKAIREGVVFADNEIPEAEPFESGLSKDTSNLVKMKCTQARVQGEVVHKATHLSELLAKEERLRNGAVQEAAFYRAKLAAYESGSAADVSRVEVERSGQLESKLAALSADYSVQETKLRDMQEVLNQQNRSREQAELRSIEACSQLESLQESVRTLLKENTDFQVRAETDQTTLREQAERLISQSSQLEQKDAECSYTKSRLHALDVLQQQHAQFVEQTQLTLDVSSSRLSEITAQWEIAGRRISELESDLAEARSELDTRSTEATAAAARLAQVENAWAQSREEADALRSLTTQRLGELLDSHRELRISEDRIVDSHNEKVRTLEVELSSLRDLQEETKHSFEQMTLELSDTRRQYRELDVERSNLRNQLVGLRTQLSEAISEVGELRQQLAANHGRTSQLTTSAHKAEVKYAFLCRYLRDTGIPIEDDSGGDVRPFAERVDVTSEMDIESLRVQHQEALRQISALTSDLEELQQNLRGISVQDPRDEVQELRQVLADTEKNHQDRMKQLETDYQTAIHYVKGSERMLQRMKEELAKQKITNSTLQSQLEILRSSEAGLISRNTNGRGTPLSEEAHDGLSRTQILEAQRQNHRLVSENQDLRRRLDSLDHDLELMRDTIVTSQQAAEAKSVEVDKLVMEVERLEETLSLVRQGQDPSFVERLNTDNALLQRKNAELSKKIELLLEVDQTAFERERPISGISNHSSGHTRDFETFSNELDDWHRKVAGTTLHARFVDNSQV